MLPPAPTRLSTTTCWPRVSLSCDDMDRAMTSVAPPGPALTTSRIDFAGQVCAHAAEAKANATAIRQRAIKCMLGSREKVRASAMSMALTGIGPYKTDHRLTL